MKQTLSFILGSDGNYRDRAGVMYHDQVGASVMVEHWVHAGYLLDAFITKQVQLGECYDIPVISKPVFK
jgi:hypothetical protein